MSCYVGVPSSDSATVGKTSASSSSDEDTMPPDSQNDSAGNGTSDGPENIPVQCGNPDYVHVESGAGLPPNADPPIFDSTFIEKHEKPVGVLHWTGTEKRGCSGTLISNNLFLTAGHCLKPQCNIDVCSEIHVDFNYQFIAGKYQKIDEKEIGEFHPYDNDDGDGYPCEEVVECSDDVDYAILKLKNTPGDIYGFANLLAYTPQEDNSLDIDGDGQQPDHVILIGHPNRFGSNEDDPRPKVASEGPTLELNKKTIKYKVDTDGGSSGSGVLISLPDKLQPQERDAFLIGIHTTPGDCKNGGVLLREIIKDLEEKKKDEILDEICGCQTPNNKFDSSLPPCEKACGGNTLLWKDKCGITQYEGPDCQTPNNQNGSDKCEKKCNGDKIVWKDQCGGVQDTETEDCSIGNSDNTCKSGNAGPYCGIQCGCQTPKNGYNPNLPECVQSCNKNGDIEWKDKCGDTQYTQYCSQGQECKSGNAGPYCGIKCGCNIPDSPVYDEDLYFCMGSCEGDKIKWVDQCGQVQYEYCPEGETCAVGLKCCKPSIQIGDNTPTCAG